MATEPIRASSSAPTAEDERLRAITSDLISQQNKNLIDLGQKMLTLTFAAIGVVLAVQDQWFGGETTSATSRCLLIAALVVFLLSAPVYLLVVKGYKLAVTTDDYQDVEQELARLGRLRGRLTTTGTVMTGIATVLLAIAIFAGSPAG